MDKVRSSKKILIVDDEEPILHSLNKNLEQDGWIVTLAQNGTQAQQMFGLEKFDVVLTDINMPGTISGLVLLKYIKQNSNTPVILMTGFSDLVEAKEASELGASGFLTKPFIKDDLLKVLYNAINSQEAHGLRTTAESTFGEVSSENLQEFSKISIDDFVSGSEIKYNIFIQLSEKKFVRIAYEGQNISLDRIKTYKEKGIAFLYLRLADFQKYLQFNIGLSGLVINSSAISQEKKIHLLKHTSDLLLEDLFFHNVDKEKYVVAASIVENIVRVLANDEYFGPLLEALHSHSDALYSHSLAVSLYSVLIAKKLNWSAHSTIFKISLSGMLHDIGKKEIPFEILNKPRHLYSLEEVRMHESHPSRGMEILREMPDVPEEVIQAVLHHHENGLGTGFPFQLRNFEIQPMARLIYVADKFCKLAFSTPPGHRPPPDKIMKDMHQMQSNELDLQHFEALHQILGVEGLAS